MEIKLPKIVNKSKKRLGRGYGSGKGGHTVGRGQKGQKARTKIGVLFEGMKVKKSLLKKLPLQRGKDKFKARQKPIIVKMSLLNLLPKGSEVNLDLLVKHGIVEEKAAKVLGVKILGDGEISQKMIVDLPISHSAAKKIEKAGGKVISKNFKSEK
jgi:large subunit ribosomal protein L15